MTNRDEYESLRALIRRYLGDALPVEAVASLDAAGEFPQSAYEGLARLGACGIAIPEEYGGNPMDAVSTCIIIEEVARSSASVGYAYVPTALFCAKALVEFGTPAQREAILPGIAAGKVRLALGFSEPDAGSDLASVRTRGQMDGDTITINGQKTFCTGPDTADYILTLVRTDPNVGQGHTGMSLILVPRSTPGLTIRPLRKLAGQGTHTCEVFFDDVSVPATALLGEVNGGMKPLFRFLDAERVYIGAQSAGLAAGALSIATRYALERVQFGKPIIDHQAVAHHLADMAIDVEIARSLTLRAAALMDAGEPYSYEASVAKVGGSEAGTRCALRGMQVLGGYSYIVEYGMERYLRETKLYEIGGGTNEIQRNIIAKHLRRAAATL